MMQGMLLCFHSTNILLVLFLSITDFINDSTHTHTYVLGLIDPQNSEADETEMMMREHIEQHKER